MRGMKIKFTINNRVWKIKEVEQGAFWEDDGKEMNLSEGRFFGRCLFARQEIWIDKDLSQEQKRITLMHELMHCYRGSYITFEEMNGSSEDVLCDISANSHDIIHEIVEKYFRN